MQICFATTNNQEKTETQLNRNITLRDFEIPWNKDELTVAVEGLVEDDPVLASSHPVSHVASFNLLPQRKYRSWMRFHQYLNPAHLRERFRAIISLAAAVTRGSSLRPVEIPVPVGQLSIFA